MKKPEDRNLVRIREAFSELSVAKLKRLVKEAVETILCEDPPEGSPREAAEALREIADEHEREAEADGGLRREVFVKALREVADELERGFC
jgi:hypothetical protein